MKFSKVALASSLALVAQASPIAQAADVLPDPDSVQSGPSDASLRNMPLTRSGTELLLNGTRFIAGAANIYWLGLDENVIPPAGQPFYAPYTASYPTKGRITEAMNTVRAMGGKMIRGHTLGISFGNPLSLWPTLNTTNEQAWETIDWAIYSARQHGLRLQIPIMDNYDWYHGGKFVWLRWFGLNLTPSPPPASGTTLTIPADPRVMQFYTNETIISGYKSYLNYWLTHKNQYTGLTIAEDPTVAIIETGNELGGPIFGDKWVPNSWTQEIAAYVKSLAPNKLIMDGTYGINSTHFSVSSIDVFSDHFYPLSISKLQSGVAAVASTNRTYFAGEYDWVGQSGGDNLTSWFSVIESYMSKGKDSVIVGDAFWSLFGHDVGAPQGCQKYVNHSDGFTLQYNNPLNSADINKRIGEISQHLKVIGGKKKAGTETPKVGCPGPVYLAGGA